MHAIEKLLAKAAGKEAVTTGEIVNCAVDMAGINDLYLQTVRSFYEMGGTRVHAPDKLIVFLDHYAPASSIMQAENLILSTDAAIPMLHERVIQGEAADIRDAVRDPRERTLIKASLPLRLSSALMVKVALSAHGCGMR